MNQPYVRKFFQRHRITAVLFFAAALLIWWVASAGATTVYRILIYNFSGVDDDLIFPKRPLEAAPIPFRFEESINPNIPHLTIKVDGQKDIFLSDLLERSETSAFLIIKNDTIVYEKYYDGYDRATPSLSFSMAKSILSLLVGCAIDDGYIKSVNQPVTDFVPELAGKGFTAVTIQNLLQMTSGINYVENDMPFGIHARLYYTDHLEDEILKFSLQEPPGTRFTYRSSDALLLSLALDRALSNGTITEYTQERIWNPLGMENGGGWSIDHAPDGLEKTGCCLSATARDFAKIERLYLNKGEWNGNHIVSESWIDASTKIDTSAGSSWEYQYMWWLVAPDRSDFMAVGHLGQFIYVNPDTRVVIVRLGRSLGNLSRDEWKNIFVSLSDAIR